MDRSGQHGSCRRFRRIGFIADIKLAKKFLGIGQHVHKMADRGTLVSPNIADAAFQQCLCNGKDTFAGKGVTFAEPEVLHFLRK